MLLQGLRNFFPPKPQFTSDMYPDLTGKVVIVTGGNSGVGYESAKLLASKNAKVYILSRNPKSTQEAITKMKGELKGESDINFIKVDLSDLSTVKVATTEFTSKETRLDIIVHNAAVMIPANGSKTAQGHELQLGTNIIGPFLLQKLLNPIMIETSKRNPDWKTRVVWVTSSAHNLSPKNGVEMENLNQDFHSSSMRAYGHSKAAMIIVSKKYWEKEFKKVNANILSLSVDPGILKSNLQRTSKLSHHFVRLLGYEPIYGAYSELYGALEPNLGQKDTGAYVIPWGRIGIVREDVVVSAGGSIGERFWDFLEESVKDFI